MVGYNSAVIYSSNGSFLGNYRKVNMFETDKTWAKPGGSKCLHRAHSLKQPSGNQFMTLSIPSFPPQFQVMTVAICMDLNPHPPVEWTLSTGPYELADYCRSRSRKDRSNVLVLLNAWLDSRENEESKWDVRTVNYWAARLRPLWDVEHVDEKEAGEDSTETVVIVCNRCGADDGELVISSLMFSSQPEFILNAPLS